MNYIKPDNFDRRWERLLAVEPVNESSKLFRFGIVQFGQFSQTLVDIVKPEQTKKNSFG